MKKLFAVLALVGVMTSCNNKKKDEKKAEGDTTVTTTPPADNNGTTTDVPPSNSGVPKFSDPEVQKFADDYAAFMNEYKAGMTDPAKATELASKLQEWSKKSTEIGMKLATKPDEAKAWAEWVTSITKDMMPGGAK